MKSSYQKSPHQIARMTGWTQNGVATLGIVDLRRIVVCVLAIVLLAGCYGSPVALEDAPSRSVDPAWLGTWIETGKEDPRTMTVSAYKDNWYKVYAEGEEDSYEFYAFATRLGGETMISFRQHDSNTWHFARVRGRGGSWQLAPLSTGAVDGKYSSSVALRAAMRPVVRRSDIFYGVYNLKRVRGRSYHFTNACAHPLQLAINYRDVDGDWKTVGWWKFGPGESAYLSSKGRRLSTTNSIWYYYAETTDGTDWRWTGKDLSVTYGGRTLKMRKMQKQGDYTWKATCR